MDCVQHNWLDVIILDRLLSIVVLQLYNFSSAELFSYCLSMPAFWFGTGICDGNFTAFSYVDQKAKG